MVTGNRVSERPNCTCGAVFEWEEKRESPPQIPPLRVRDDTPGVCGQTAAFMGKRGEVWRADLGDGKKHAVVIISLDGRNLSDRASSY